VKQLIFAILLAISCFSDCHCGFREDFIYEQQKIAKRNKRIASSKIDAWINSNNFLPAPGISVLVYEVQTRQFSIDMTMVEYPYKDISEDQRCIWISRILEDDTYDTYWQPLPVPPKI
jgi:hypothetical protein